jgi:osmotically-inducible protein OsmY
MKSDLQLQQDVVAELDWEPAVQAAPIAVLARHGVVCLRGALASHGQVWSAERAAWRVAGVRALQQQLTVRQASADRHSDTDIAHAVRNVLSWLVQPPAHAVQVVVQGGNVGLSGHVRLPAQKHDMLHAVQRLAGVQALNDTVRVQAGAAAAQQELPDRSQIEAAIRRRMPSAAQPPVRVLVQDSGVTLSGLVRSPAERALVRHAAWGTPGVCAVHDRLQLIG